MRPDDGGRYLHGTQDTALVPDVGCNLLQPRCVRIVNQRRVACTGEEDAVLNTKYRC